MSAVTQNKDPFENVFGEDNKQTLFKLRELVQENSELSEFLVDDAHLLQFLYATSFDLTNAIDRIKSFQNSLIKHPTWFAAKPPLELKNMIEKNIICLLDSRDKEGRAIFVTKAVNFDLTSSLDENATIVELVVDYSHMKVETCANGLSVIFDMENIPWKLLTWATPRNIKIMVELINVYPCKDIKVHIVKTSFILDAIIKIVWPLLPANIKEMIKFHFNNWSSLHEYIAPENLPDAYGGTGPDVNFNFYNEKMYKQNDKIKDRLKYRQALRKLN